MSLMIVYDDDAGATQRRFMAMEREDLRHRSDVERLMNSLVPRGWGRSRWDRKPRSVPKPPPLKLCSFCDELKMKPEFSGQNWAKDEAAGCRCCMVRRIDDQKSRKEARASDFKATFVYPAPLTAGRVIAEEAVSQVGDLPDPEHPPSPTGIPTLTPAQISKCGPRSWSTHDLPKPREPRRVTQQSVDSQSRRKEVEQGCSSVAALSRRQKKNIKKRHKNPKKRQRIRQVRDGHWMEDCGSDWWAGSPDEYSPVMTAGQRHSLHEWLIADPLPLLTPLLTKSMTEAEQIDLAEEQRQIRWRKQVEAVGIFG